MSGNPKTPYRVSQGGSVKAPHGYGTELYTAGCKLPTDWPSSVYKELLNSGYIEKDRNWHETADLPTDAPPGVDPNKTPVIPGLDSTQDGGGARMVANPDAGSQFRTTDPAIVRPLGGTPRPESSVTSSDSGVTTRTAPANLPPRQPLTGDAQPVEKRDPGGASKWNMNPAALEGLTLDQLNAMILERDGAVTPFETVGEAAAFLSADFQQ